MRMFFFCGAGIGEVDGQQPCLWGLRTSLIFSNLMFTAQIPAERVVSNLAEYGNTSAASIPLALDEAVRSGSIKQGDTVSFLLLDPF